MGHINSAKGRHRSAVQESFKGNFLLDHVKVDYALYKLLCSFLASPAIAEMVATESYDSFVFTQIIDEHEDKEILDSLFYSAAFLRIADDLKQISTQSMHATVGKITVGQITKPLTLREACNKVIHADRLKYVYGENRQYKYIEEYLEPVIRLFGKSQDGKKRWRATLDIKRYVELAHKALF